MNYEKAHELLRYDPDTGILYWRIRVSRGTKAGSMAGGSNGKYAALRFKGRLYLSHRVIWLMVSGEWPEQIDHIDGNPGNNRLDNLRNVSSQENMQNKRLRHDNASGVQGVGWHKQAKKWQANITVAKKQIGLGIYADKAQAIAKRKMAEVIYGFHVNHGRTT